MQNQKAQKPFMKNQMTQNRNVQNPKTQRPDGQGAADRIKSRHIVLGILAHVDAGKTTLSESLLYLSGAIRRQGRVDHGDTYLDTDRMEKERGITIFSKQAELTLDASLLSSGGQAAVPIASPLSGGGQTDRPGAGITGPADGLSVTLLDTPGHADFSPEMERALSVLDYAVLIISAPDGITGQVRTLWRLLDHYRIPVFLFVNKMDQPGMDRDRILKELSSGLSEFCIPLPDTDPALFDDRTKEALAVCDDRLLENYLESGISPDSEDIAVLTASRKLFPVFFGSALKSAGVDALGRALVRFCREPLWPKTFAAKVFKISRDPSGVRLAWMRVLGGVMKAKMTVREDREALSDSGQDLSRKDPSGPDSSGDGSASSGLKIDQIRQYSGDSFTTLREAPAGSIVCAAGLSGVRAGALLTENGLPGKAPHSADQTPAGVSGLPDEPGVILAQSLLRRAGEEQLILPVFRRAVLLPEGTDPAAALKNLRILEEEEPMLGISYDTRTKEISAEIMGEVETEILTDLCEKRFGMKIAFGPPSIVYRETVAGGVEGVGHYEPLRHYAEVHLLIEPAERGSGIHYDSRLSRDALSLNAQRLILSSLMNTKLRGVLTGSELTDVQITLIGGRASEKHTEGGDFRQASIRAVRQGLMSAESILLEPWYRFEAEVPADSLGRLMSDIDRMDGHIDPAGGDGRRAVLTGTVPAAEAGDYAAEVRAYTHGTGQITFSLSGYEPCRHPEDIILEKNYDPAADLEQPADSVFCSHGAGVVIPWNEVRNYMHVDTGWRPAAEDSIPEHSINGPDSSSPEAFSSGWRRSHAAGTKTWKEQQAELSAGEDELRRIFEQTYRGSSWNTPLHNRENEDLQSGENSGSGSSVKPGRKSPVPAREDFLLVDGYNIIFAWKELRSLASVNLDSAAGRLIDILSDYQGTQSGRMIIVFDAYKVRGGARHILHHGNVDVIYTKEAETADSYIMELTHSLARRGNVTVATGDGIVQMIIFGAGARRMPPSELLDRVTAAKADIREKYHTVR